MEHLFAGMAAVFTLYGLGYVIVLLGIVAYGSGNPGFLHMLAQTMDEPPKKELTERDFLMAIAFTCALSWPIMLLAWLDRDGQWKG